MRVLVASIGIGVLFGSSLLHAQQGAVGTYKGDYVAYEAGHPVQYSGVLQISSVENGKVTGKYSVSGPYCRGDYAVEGTIQDKTLNLKTGDGAMRGCGNESMLLNLEGDQLVGTYSRSQVRFSRK